MKLPLLSSPNKPTKIAGVVVYGLIFLMILGALSPRPVPAAAVDDDAIKDTSLAGHTGHLQYAGVSFELPKDFYVVDTISNSTAWSIEARKDGSHNTSQALMIYWGTWLPPAKIDTKNKYLTHTASGQDAWIDNGVGQYANRSNVQIDYQNMFIKQAPNTDDAPASEGLTPEQFENFVKSISIT